MKLDPLPHQRLMTDFLLKHRRAALWASPGLSKTAAVLSALNDLFAEGEIRKTLVLAPLRVAKLTWPNEIARWSDFHWLRHSYLPSPNAHLVTLNYERLQDLETLAGYDVVVMDESTKLKNPASVRVHHLWKLLQAQPQIRRWGLTGTPRPNNLMEIHSQIRLLDDGKRLSPSFDHFQSTYFVPDDPYTKYTWSPKPDSERKIYEKISDLCLTLRASDYLDIPDMVIEDIEMALPKDAHAHYRTLERELVLLLNESAVVARNAAILVGKLLQVCSGEVYDEERRPTFIHHGKLTALKRLLLERCEGENCIIAHSFRHERERILKSLGSEAVDLSTFKGDIEKAWNSKSIKYLVAHPDSLGHGLNLQEGGRTVIWFSPIHSREKFDQLNARVFRKGQKQESRIFRLVTTGTIEEAVVETLRVRGDQQSEMMGILANFQKLGRIFK